MYCTLSLGTILLNPYHLEDFIITVYSAWKFAFNYWLIMCSGSAMSVMVRDVVLCASMRQCNKEKWCSCFYSKATPFVIGSLFHELRKWEEKKIAWKRAPPVFRAFRQWRCFRHFCGSIFEDLEWKHPTLALSWVLTIALRKTLIFFMPRSTR